MRFRAGRCFVLVSLLGLSGCQGPAVPEEELGTMVFGEDMSEVPGAQEPVELPLPTPPEEEADPFLMH